MSSHRIYGTGREKTVFTTIHRSGIVKKRAVYPKGRDRLEKMIEYGNDLAKQGIAVVDTKMEDDSYRMPYVNAEVGQVYLKRLLQTDKEEFLKKMDMFRDLILQSSKIVKADSGDGEEAILQKGYLDMVPLNSFYKDGTFIFNDQEFCEENYPANVIVWRMVNLVGIDFEGFIMQLGYRLKVLHIHDNDGVGDIHQIPFTFTRIRENTASTDWGGFIRGLRGVKYDGALSF